MTVIEDFDKWLDEYIEGIKKFRTTHVYTSIEKDIIRGMGVDGVNEQIQKTAEKIRDKWKSIIK